MPAKKPDATTDATERNEDPIQRDGSATDPAPQEVSVDLVRWDVTFRLFQGQKYHGMRENWYRSAINTCNLITLIGSGSVMAMILKDAPPAYSTLVAAVVGLCGIFPTAGCWADQLAKHSELRAGFSKLYSQIKRGALLDDILRKQSRLDRKMAGNRRAVSIMAHNQAVLVLLGEGSEEHLVKLGRWERLTAHIFEHPTL